MEVIKNVLALNPLLYNNHWISIAVFFLLVSILLHGLNKRFLSIVLLIVGSLLLNFSYIQLDPFLNSWDERFHVLVAKNMTEYPLRPMLYVNPILEYDFKDWRSNHIWLHKQPLFLWQMALSIKLFGFSETAARLPSALMISILIPVIYRVGRLIFNANTGFLAALLTVTNNFILEHITGKQELEHNDVAFMFYVFLSIWAWVEFEMSRKTKWLVLAGVFSGCGILVKWLTALLFYSGFGMYHFLFKNDMFKKQMLFSLAYSLFATLLVALPWQWYISAKYPLESAYEYSFSASHFLKALEGHAGDNLFYLSEMPAHYSILAPLILVGFVLSLFNSKNRQMRLTFIFIIAFVYLFFSLAATKMTSFVMPVAPLCFLFIAYCVNEFLHKFINSKFGYLSSTCLLVSFLFFRNLHIDKTATLHWRNPDTYWGRFMQNTADNTSLYKKMADKVPGSCVVTFCNQFEEIDCMFYSGITAYSYLSAEKIKELKAKGYRIAAFKNNLPDYVTADSTILIIEADYKVNKSVF